MRGCEVTSLLVAPRIPETIRLLSRSLLSTSTNITRNLAILLLQTGCVLRHLSVDNPEPRSSRILGNGRISHIRFHDNKRLDTAIPILLLSNLFYSNFASYLDKSSVITLIPAYTSCCTIVNRAILGSSLIYRHSYRSSELLITHNHSSIYPYSYRHARVLAYYRRPESEFLNSRTPRAYVHITSHHIRSFDQIWETVEERLSDRSQW